jgi:Ala-tRNA(Pro) deacylase
MVAKQTTWMSLEDIEAMERRMRQLLGSAQRPMPKGERATRFTRYPGDPLVNALRREHVSYERFPHRRTETAMAEAEALAVDPDQVAKTLILKTPSGYARAVLRAGDRLDLEKARRALGTLDIELADEVELVGAYPEFELGAVPPIGGPFDRVLVDERVFDHPFVFFEAGTHHESIRLRTGELLSIAEAEVADLAEATIEGRRDEDENLR